MIEIKQTEDDDGGFVTLASLLINGVVRRHDAEKLYLIHIKNWFDRKWLEFSGKVLGQLGVWKSRTTYPPFNPNRVLSERLLVREVVSDAVRERSRRPLHIWQPSSNNLYRPIPDDPVVYAWYSSGTERNERGSAMVYVGNAEHWYASFIKRDNWQVHRFAGISRAEFDSYMKACGAESDSETISDTH